MGKKADKTEMEKRIYFVYGLLLQGYQTGDICRHVSEKFDVQSRQAERYIRDARKRFHKENKIELDLKRSEIISQYYHLYQMSYDIEDYKECRSILKEISDILGVKAAKIIELQGNPDKPLGMPKVALTIE